MKTTLSPVVSGTMNWGVWDKKLSTSEMAQAIHVCLENGISSFDHADVYGDYTTQAEFGKALQHSGISRDRLQLISKAGVRPAGGEIASRHYDYSAAHLISAAENSLRDLQTDYLDVFLLHRPSPLLDPEEVAKAVTQLQKQGKIRDFGVANFSPIQMDLIRKFIPVDCAQVVFSATHLDPMLNGTLDYFRLHDIAPMAWNPLGSVFRVDSEQTRRLKKLLVQFVSKYGVGADTLLLAWILKHPAGIRPIAGTVNVARLQQLKKATQLELDLQDWFAIWSESTGQPLA